MSNFIPEAEQISNDLSENWRKLAEKTSSLNKTVSTITSLAEKGYTIQTSKESSYIVELLIRYYVGGTPGFHSTGFVGIGNDLESALNDLVSDERLDLGEAK